MNGLQIYVSTIRSYYYVLPHLPLYDDESIVEAHLMSHIAPD